MLSVMKRHDRRSRQFEAREQSESIAKAEAAAATAASEMAVQATLAAVAHAREQERRLRVEELVDESCARQRELEKHKRLHLQIQ